MSMIEKLVKYSVDEIGMADNYTELARYVEDPMLSQKLNEMAKDEMKHYDYIASIIKKQEMSEESCKEMTESYRHVMEDYKDKVSYKINSYQPKK